MSTSHSTTHIDDYVNDFRGLAPFARINLEGGNLLALGQALLTRMGEDANNPVLLMNLSLALQSLGQHDIGVAIQGEALALQRVYTLKASKQPARFRLLLLCVEGDIAENTPIDCLLEGMDIDIIFYYITPNNPLAEPIPEHDVLMVGICDADEHTNRLLALIPLLEHWSKPVINQAPYIANTGRKVASLLLQAVPGLLMPPTLRAQPSQLRSIAQGQKQLSDYFRNLNFPIIVRPVGSHAGHDLERIEQAQQLNTYLNHVHADAFFISSFIDYSADDGLFRKLRVVLIDGKPYIAHLAVSSHWMIHYVNAGMYEDAQKREEEKTMMANFDAFIARHLQSLNAIYQRTKLDYLGLDCAETKEGKLLIFEIDHVMVVHDMDPVAHFAYKHETVMKAKNAFRDMLIRVTEGNKI